MKVKIVSLIVLAALVIAGVLIYVNANKKENQPNTNSQKTFTPLPVTEVDHSRLPERFPADIPLESGAVIVYNFNLVNAAGMYQSTRQFVSKKTIKQNFDFYQDALKKAGYSITKTLDDLAHNQELIYATKGDNKVTVRSFASGGQIKVDITNETKP